MGFLKSLFNSGRELNKLSENVARVKILLDKIDSLSNSDVNDYLFAAYICRVTILDRVERNEWFLDTLILYIPINGVLMKMKYSEAYMMSVGRLSLKAGKLDEESRDKILDVLKKGEEFHKIDMTVPPEKKKQF